MKGTCRVCSRTFYGRSDKQFCSDHCRMGYHNARNRQDKLVRHINKRLLENRHILRDIYHTDRDSRLDPQTLVARGYSFAYHTHQSGSNGYFCYDYGFIFEHNHCLVRIIHVKDIL